MANQRTFFDATETQYGREVRTTYPAKPGHKENTTSKEAAESIAPHASTLRVQVQTIIAMHKGGISADAVADILKETVLSVRPRVSELKAEGIIEEAPGHATNASGLRAKLWRIKR